MEAKSQKRKDVCPKCGSIFIEWNGGCYHCVERDCLHRWTVWTEGPKKFEEIENPHLKASLPLHSFIPYSNHKK